ncbi:MAG TPA: hypothetical protein VGR81_13180 [Candidatus Acidoferrales bacterium]|nr:hypothetical protein [Candidatus Acidoferrales bacterium]
MDNQRRFFLAAVISSATAVGATLLTTRLAEGQNGHPLPTGPQILPSNSDRPGTAPAVPPLRTRAILEANQKEIKKDVDQLFSLAQDLKTQTEKVDSSQVLSVAFVDKTQQIEKLAKRICDLARL